MGNMLEEASQKREAEEAIAKAHRLEKPRVKEIRRQEEAARWRIEEQRARERKAKETAAAALQLERQREAELRNRAQIEEQRAREQKEKEAAAAAARALQLERQREAELRRQEVARWRQQQIEEQRALEQKEKEAAAAAARALQLKLQRVVELRRQEEARLQFEKKRAKKRESFALQIDEYIRTRKKFNGSDPLAYACGLSSILAEFEGEHSAFVPESTLEFIKSQARFVVVKSSCVKVRFLTPFQGEDAHRVFGDFKCSHCHRNWSSAASWKNKWQKCQSCEMKIYPYRQHVLKKQDEATQENRQQAPHDMARCQKCRELGRLCVPSMYYSI